MTALSDALTRQLLDGHGDADVPRKVYSVLAGRHINFTPRGAPSRGSFDVTILDRDDGGRMARMRIASLGGEVEYDVLATHRDSQGRLVQLRITQI